jgi:hypothetical protein
MPENMIFKIKTKQVGLSMLAFWVVTPCGILGRYQCFGETYRLLLGYPEDGAGMFPRHVCNHLQEYTASLPRRQCTRKSVN